jgi:hypothetical protein
MLDDLSDAVADGKVPHLLPDLRVERMDALRHYLHEGFERSDLRKFFMIDVDVAVEKLREHDGKLPKPFEMLRMRAVNYGAPQRQNILRTRVVVDDKQYQMGNLHVDVNYACALDKPPGR